MEDLANRPQCPECGSHFVVKDGKQWGKQTYLCKDGRIEKYLFVGDRSMETFLKDTLKFTGSSSL